MPSGALNNYMNGLSNSQLIRKKIQVGAANLIFSEKQVFYHAALASNVAAWDSYVNNIVREFYNFILSSSINSDYRTLHSISVNQAENLLRKFNTPNAENTRNLLLQCTGYDPIADWVWARRGMSGLDTRTRLNEILKVRHSFAHGFSMPSYTWNSSNAGTVRLTSSIIKFIEDFFKFLVFSTENGVKREIESHFSVVTNW